VSTASAAAATDGGLGRTSSVDTNAFGRRCGGVSRLSRRLDVELPSSASFAAFTLSYIVLKRSSMLSICRLCSSRIASLLASSSAAVA